MYIMINDIIGKKRMVGRPAVLGDVPLRGPRKWKLQLLACLAVMFSIGYGGL